MIKKSDGAFRYVCQVLENKGHKILRTETFNHDRHILIITNKEKFYVLFKHEFFLTFYKQFPQWSQQNPTGYGESINKYFLEKAIQYDATLLFIYPNKKIYRIYPLIIKKICEENNLIREQDKTNTYKLANYDGRVTNVKEVTYSFPLFLFERYG